ncbi:hypothetical protein BC831DRAFT_454816 [Entophlyctis helioformis]|nr:hypothetical protein BC831DRAFT_454816 [Entophlyctis helioformis]
MSTSQQHSTASPPAPAPAADDDEDPYITRIKRSGCFPEHERLQDCYYDKHDWRKCRDEMALFRACFARQASHSHLVAAPSPSPLSPSSPQQ